MKREEIVLLWLDYNSISFSKFEKILSKFDQFDDIFNEKLVKNALFDDKTNELLTKLRNANLDEFAQNTISQMEKYGVHAITFLSKGYPQKLAEIDDPPLVLYVKGNEELLTKKSISIVGTRKPTTYGKIVCEKFSKELSEAGLVTVSGLAYGIDTIVAEKTLETGGKTIAVLAGGLDSIYPSQNTGLASKIVEKGGLLVTEYHIGIKPANYHFVNRNRIVSALGLGLVIVEAGKHSGTMTTANFALEQSRELFVVPGNINSLQSEGTNSLIDQMPDIFTISTNRILFKLGIKKQTEPKSAMQVDLIENSILDLLKVQEMSFDAICDELKISASALSATLIKLEMFGLVKKGEGNIYYKV